MLAKCNHSATLNVPLNAEVVICLLNYPNSTLVSKFNSRIILMHASGIFILPTAVRSLATFVILILLLQIIINEELKTIIFTKPKHVLIFIRILFFKLLIILLSHSWTFLPNEERTTALWKLFVCNYIILEFLTPSSGEKIQKSRHWLQLRNFPFAGFFVKSIPEPES